MKQLGDILLLDIILLVLSSFFGLEGLLKVLVIEVIYTLIWIGNHV